METGNRIVMNALDGVRQYFCKNLIDDFNVGHALGAVCIAEYYVGADRFIAEGARNEIHFLRNESRRKHAAN